MKDKTENLPLSCPCESGLHYKNCCQPYLEQIKDAPTAEALMRSRYTAFVLKNEAYLRYSWHPDYCPADIHVNEKTKWLGLKIKKTNAGGKGDSSGEVEFIARSRLNGKASRLHETSRFTRLDSRWVYLDGNFKD